MGYLLLGMSFMLLFLVVYIVSILVLGVGVYIALKIIDS